MLKINNDISSSSESLENVNPHLIIQKVKDILTKKHEEDLK